MIVEAHESRVDGLEHDLQVAQDELSLEARARSVSSMRCFWTELTRQRKSRSRRTTKVKIREDLHSAQLELETLKRTSVSCSLISTQQHCNLKPNQSSERAEQRAASLVSELEKERRAQQARERC